jgi:hypothetical protein
MKLSKIITGAALAAVLGAAAAPAFAGEMSTMPAKRSKRRSSHHSVRGRISSRRLAGISSKPSAGHSTILMPTRTSALRKLYYRMADTTSWRQI